MWEKETAEAVPRVANPIIYLHVYVSSDSCYLVIIFYLAYNVYDMELCSIPTCSIITALTSNGASNYKYSIARNQMRKQKLTHSF